MKTIKEILERETQGLNMNKDTKSKLVFSYYDVEEMMEELVGCKEYNKCENLVDELIKKCRSKSNKFIEKDIKSLRNKIIERCKEENKCEINGKLVCENDKGN